MSEPWVSVEHGFVIVRPDGRLAEDHVYRMREPAEHIASMLFPGCKVFPARRVYSLRKSSTTTVKLRSEIVIEREVA